MDELKSIYELLEEESCLVHALNKAVSSNEPKHIQINLKAMIRLKRKQISECFSPSTYYGVPKEVKE